MTEKHRESAFRPKETSNATSCGISSCLVVEEQQEPPRNLSWRVRKMCSIEFGGWYRCRCRLEQLPSFFLLCHDVARCWRCNSGSNQQFTRVSPLTKATQNTSHEYTLLLSLLGQLYYVRTQNSVTAMRSQSSLARFSVDGMERVKSRRDCFRRVERGWCT